MRWKMLPVSVAAHVVALIACVVVPLDGGIDLPSAWPSSVNAYITASAAPPPSEVVVRREPSAVPSTAAPIAPPDRIAAEEEPRVGPTAEGSISNGPGVVSGIGVGMLPEAHITPPQLPLTPAPPTIVRAGGAIREPRKIVNVQPVYPEIARDAGIQGLVIIEATIDERGSVVDARVLRSQPLLDGAALAAVRQWRYTPTLLNGVPVRVLMTVTINFSLGNRVP
jgi:periplasmic protein TonB